MRNSWLVVLLVGGVWLALPQDGPAQAKPSVAPSARSTTDALNQKLNLVIQALEEGRVRIDRTTLASYDALIEQVIQREIAVQNAYITNPVGIVPLPSPHPVPPVQLAPSKSLDPLPSP